MESISPLLRLTRVDDIAIIQIRHLMEGIYE